METEKLHMKIDSVIKKIWNDNILKDYNDDFLLKEDTLKNSFYFHLRNELGDGFFKYHRLRIFTEYELGENKAGKRQRGDVVIVRLKPLCEIDDFYYLGNRVEDVITIIELKYKVNAEKEIKKDVFKIRDYIHSKKYPNCQFYLGILFEQSYSLERGSWLKKNQKENWAFGKLTELTGHYDENGNTFISDIISHNNNLKTIKVFV